MDHREADEHAATAVDDAIRHRWVRIVRLHIRRLGSDVMGAGKRYRRSRSHGVDGEEVNPNLEARVLVHFGLALKAHQEGNTVKAALHLTKMIESIRVLLQVWTESKQEN